MHKIFHLLLIVLFIVSCKNKPDSYENQALKIGNNDEQFQNEAYKKMKTLCYSCHSPDAEIDMRMAPPMVAVKMHYTEKYNTQEDFVNAIWDFMKKPDENKALMKGAVRKFGLMPYVPYKEDDIKAIASYIYNNDLEKPEWFDEHVKEKHGKNKQGNGNKHHKEKGNGKNKEMGESQHQRRNGPKMKGKEMVMATKKELGKNLMKAIAEKGTAGAVDFCNIQALPITAAKAKEFNASIKRASDKPRNPENKATTRENEVISLFKGDLAEGKTPEAIVEKNADKFNFYYPITTNDMCLQCHGNPGKQITNETYKTIKLKYPDDLAVGYTAGEVRGIWHITFDKEMNE